MTAPKMRLAVLFGGKSAEHEVSLLSAHNVMASADPEKYEIVPIAIDKDGHWRHGPADVLVADPTDPAKVRVRKGFPEVVLPMGTGRPTLRRLSDGKSLGHVDCVFPVLHGPMGEDGTVQGLLSLADVPFVGSGVLGSAVSMDKDIAKRLLTEANLPNAPFLSVQRGEEERFSYPVVKKALGETVFVKPANLGSSVGVSKVRDEKTYRDALREALSFDTKVVVEKEIVGREVECSVLGNRDPIASVPGEIIPSHEFYSYEAKYLDEQGAKLIVPVELPEGQTKRLQEICLSAYRTLQCEGMARVDCFICADGEIFVNELNTLPGFTQISMYPRLWEATGISYPQLIDSLVDLALERHAERSGLRLSRASKEEEF